MNVRKFTGFEAYQSDEFRAFCKKFGIPHELLTKEITITLTEDDIIVNHQYIVGEVVHADPNNWDRPSHKS